MLDGPAVTIRTKWKVWAVSLGDLEPQLPGCVHWGLGCRPAAACVGLSGTSRLLWDVYEPFGLVFLLLFHHIPKYSEV